MYHLTNNYFKNKLVPLILLSPQLVITLIFFVWPGVESISQSLYRGDAFGIHSYFVGLDNYYDIFSDRQYLNAVLLTCLFSIGVSVLCLISGLAMALLVNQVIKTHSWYKILLILPYAVAPAVAGILWRFMLNPAIGVYSELFNAIGVDWNYLLYGKQALWVVIITAAWQQFSYNFLFFLIGIQSIPRSLLEAARLDGAGAYSRLRYIILPLLSPTSFFLLIMNLIYAFFDAFGIIQVITRGGPANSTEILVYKVYKDGFVGLDLGSSAAQSVVLMLIVMILVALQFRYIEKRVYYS